ncbi:MAG: peptidoglycan editing factor PgeF [Armatimonadota bacterium]
MAMETLTAGHVRREASGLSWFEPVEPVGGVARVVMTTRIGGGSREPYQSLNLGLHVGDVGERVRLNRLALQKALGRHLLEPVVGDQVHGHHAAAVGALHSGTRWQAQEAALAATDALVTSTPRLPLVTLVADCVPVALVDPYRKVAAAVHAGWRGLTGGVLESALGAMQRTAGTPAGDVVAWIGPAIGPCCYEVGPEVARNFPESTAPSPDGGARSYLDLPDAVRRRLRGAGLLDENLAGLPLCTSCHPELFFSHRRATREGLTATGRQGMLVWLE